LQIGFDDAAIAGGEARILRREVAVIDERVGLRRQRIADAAAELVGEDDVAVIDEGHVSGADVVGFDARKADAAADIGLELRVRQVEIVKPIAHEGQHVIAAGDVARRAVERAVPAEAPAPPSFEIDSRSRSIWRSPSSPSRRNPLPRLRPTAPRSAKPGSVSLWKFIAPWVLDCSCQAAPAWPLAYHPGGSAARAEEALAPI